MIADNPRGHGPPGVAPEARAAIAWRGSCAPSRLPIAAGVLPYAWSIVDRADRRRPRTRILA